MSCKMAKRDALYMVCALILAMQVAMPASAAGGPLLQTNGATIGEWSGRWWNWLVHIPAATNPLFDQGSGNCAVAQQGPVWFLAGSWVGPVHRTCTVPKGRSILFPVVNYFWVQTEFDNATNTESFYRQFVFDGLQPIVNVSVTLDGQPLVFHHEAPIVRTQSPKTLARDWPVDNIFAVDPSVFEPSPGRANNGDSVLDGHWVMLPPLTVGQHTLHFRAGDATSDWQDVVYHLTIR